VTGGADPKGLVREAYRIEGITGPECRSILVDWMLGLPDDVDPRAEIARHAHAYGARYPDHPMTAVLREGLGALPVAKRRGGGRARRPPSDDSPSGG
jgi:hypothetical protein